MGAGRTETSAFGHATDERGGQIRLRLYVSGSGTDSEAAIGSLDMLRARLGGSCRTEIIDIAGDPELAESEHVLTTPTLDRLEPWPHKRVSGDLSDLEELLRVLELATDGRGPF